MTELNLQALYQNTLIKLKEGQRPLILLTPELIEIIQAEWDESLLEILCLLDHSQNTTNVFNPYLFKSLAEVKESKMLIFLLAATEKHVITEAHKTGNMIPAEFFSILKQLLQTQDPEILEWTLRTIEAMGPLNIRLKEDIRKIRPGLKKFFNSHLRASDEIINLLENQWKKKR